MRRRDWPLSGWWLGSVHGACLSRSDVERRGGCGCQELLWVWVIALHIDVLLCALVLADCKFVVLGRKWSRCEVGDGREAGVCAQDCFVFFHFRLRTHLSSGKREGTGGNFTRSKCSLGQIREACILGHEIHAYTLFGGRLSSSQCDNYRNHFDAMDQKMIQSKRSLTSRRRLHPS